jgi:hypothetical protein
MNQEVAMPSGKPTIHSGFARFSDHSARDRFVSSVLDPDPGLKDRAFLPETRPTIVFDQLSTHQRDRVKSALEGDGEWFDDIQFKPM